MLLCVSAWQQGARGSASRDVQHDRKPTCSEGGSLRYGRVMNSTGLTTQREKKVLLFLTWYILLRLISASQRKVFWLIEIKQCQNVIQIYMLLCKSPVFLFLHNQSIVCRVQPSTRMQNRRLIRRTPSIPASCSPLILRPHAGSIPLACTAAPLITWALQTAPQVCFHKSQHFPNWRAHRSRPMLREPC